MRPRRSERETDTLQLAYGADREAHTGNGQAPLALAQAGGAHIAISLLTWER